jgi:uncharacterized membrane protein YdjX (TVP38/TMEM64 family)
LHEYEVVVQGIVAVVNQYGHAVLDQILEVIQPQLDQWVKSNPGLATSFGFVLFILFVFSAIALLSLGAALSEV